MQTYRVGHKNSGAQYYVLADTPEHAVQRVMVSVRDTEGPIIWFAREDWPVYGLTVGIVLDRTGQRVA